MTSSARWIRKSIQDEELLREVVSPLKHLPRKLLCVVRKPGTINRACLSSSLTLLIAAGPTCGLATCLRPPVHLFPHMGSPFYFSTPPHSEI